MRSCGEGAMREKNAQRTNELFPSASGSVSSTKMTIESGKSFRLYY
jgi:hypothetical protein